MAVPIAYVSGALGPKPRTMLQTSNKEVVWNRSDMRIRLLPPSDAASILKSNPADFAECVFVEEGHGGLGPDDLRELAATGAITVEQYTPKGGSEPVDVLVLDAKTLRAVAEFTGKPEAAAPIIITTDRDDEE